MTRALCLALSLGLSFCIAAARAADSLETIAAKVLENEKLYDNIDVTIERKYQLHDAVGPDSPLFVSITGKSRTVWQKGLTFI